MTKESVRSTSRNEGDDTPPLCDICANPMYAFHCRLICPNCGYQRDCSDP